MLKTIIKIKTPSPSVTLSHSPAQREEHTGPQGLVIQPGGVLVDRDLGVQQDGHPLRDPGGRGPSTEG